MTDGRVNALGVVREARGCVDERWRRNARCLRSEWDSCASRLYLMPACPCPPAEAVSCCAARGCLTLRVYHSAALVAGYQPQPPVGKRATQTAGSHRSR